MFSNLFLLIYRGSFDLSKYQLIYTTNTKTKPIWVKNKANQIFCIPKLNITTKSLHSIMFMIHIVLLNDNTTSLVRNNTFSIIREQCTLTCGRTRIFVSFTTICKYALLMHCTKYNISNFFIISHITNL